MNSAVIFGLLSLLTHQLSTQSIDCENLSCPVGTGITCTTYQDICDLYSACIWDTEFCEPGDNTPSCCLPAPTNEPTPSPTCPNLSNKNNPCSGYSQECCPIDSGVCYYQQTDLCLNEGGPECCEMVTESPTTLKPTPSPTCPDYSTNANPCSYYSKECCPISICYWSQSDICVHEGGPDCCVKITNVPTMDPTANPTITTTTTTSEPSQLPTMDPTANPTTSTTTPAPTTTTTAEPTTTTTTSAPTTSTTTAEPTTTTSTTTSTTSTTTSKTRSTTTTSTTTTSTTTSEPTTTTSTTSTTGKPTRKGKWPTPKPTKNKPTKNKPTPRPTMKSAMKWEMIHPAYTGSDGELLWNVYYGDFSNDERFDEFRKNEMWDCQEIRSIVASDVKFEKYQQQKSEAVLMDSGVDTIAQTQTRYGAWIIFVAMICICCFANWYKYKSDSLKLFNKYESKPLLKDAKSSDGYQQIY